MPSPNPILIAGAGIIGLSLALELDSRGHRVTIYDRAAALGEASTAAAGMLAAEDPHNPTALHTLAHFSLAHYDSFLARIAALSGIAVPYQTSITIQHHPDGTSTRLHEHSIDPRQLAPALLAAVRASAIYLREHTPLPLANAPTIHTTGAWANPHISPRKGQMLSVRLPQDLPLAEVRRAEDIYIVPRTSGPHAGTALIGATMEDAGFSKSVHAADLDELRARAARLVPALASPETAPTLEAWAGLRPYTPDGLPLIGATPGGWLATGHFRNGILLAPGTAIVLADLIEGRTPPLDLTPFHPSRFQ